MEWLTHFLLPNVVPTPFLSVVGACFLWSIPVALVVTVLIRFSFRRDKGLEDI
jgi:hypothetical protein